MRKNTRLLLGVLAVATTAATFAFDLLAELPGNRTISLRNIHTDDTVTVEYKRNGRYVPEALARVNWVMRDWRRDEQTTMDPALVDLLWEMHRELGSRAPINIISAYRSRTTNNMLRKTVGGQASESRHILGKAADVQFPDVPLKHMRYAALVRERGGVGYYPTSATPFIHVDTDRVRAWPRLPRYELALLFPNGRSQHKPAEGGDLSPDDVRVARARQPEVALQLAAFHDMRRRGPREPQPSVIAALAPGATDIQFTPAVAAPAARPVTVAAAVLQAPRLVAEPRVADRPMRLGPRPSAEDRIKLTQLAALAGMPTLIAEPALAIRPQSGQQQPKRKGVLPDAENMSPFPRLQFLTPEGVETLKGWSTGFNVAPAWEEDHPEEAAYRPFPLASFLTQTASVDDPALVRLVHPDLARAGDMLDPAFQNEPMRLKSARQVAQLMWREADGGGEADALSARDAQGVPRPVAARRVPTEASN